MKKHTLGTLFGWILTIQFVIIICTIMAPAAHAQGAAPVLPRTLPDQVVAWLTPILVPILLAGVKKIQPSIPSWVIPMLAPVLGLVIGLINNWATATQGNLWQAAGLGLMGVAVREIKDQLVPAANGGWPDTSKFPPLNG